MLKLVIQAEGLSDVAAVRMTVEEAISRCYRVTVDLISQSPGLSFDAVLRQPAVVTVEVDGTTRTSFALRNDSGSRSNTRTPAA